MRIITFDDIYGETCHRGVCACGDFAGAQHYAQFRKSPTPDNYPVVIVFKVKIDEIYIDSRDFLCTVFQLWDQVSEEAREKQTQLLCRVFGAAIKRYFDIACDTKEQSKRIAMCNLAAFDPGAVRAHLENDLTILGRYNTRFKSAFFVKAPIPADSIIEIVEPKDRMSIDDSISLDQFIGR